MIRIVHASDVHIGDACDADLAAAQSAINELAPDCVVLTGDLTQSGRRREFAATKAWLAGIKAPIVGCPGNHDAPVFALHRRFTAPFGRFRDLGLASHWRAPEGAVRVLAINSARGAQLRPDWSQGVYGGEDLARAFAPDAAHWRVIACHHPPQTPPGARLSVRTRNASAMLERLRGAGRTLLLCGHVHAFTVQAVGMGIIATAATLASPRVRGDGQGFNLVELDQKGWRITRWRHQSGAYLEAESVAGGLGADAASASRRVLA
jgi:3',5'-cyclic AMP phosphodiesterase CpdA